MATRIASGYLEPYDIPGLRNYAREILEIKYTVYTDETMEIVVTYLEGMEQMPFGSLTDYLNELWSDRDHTISWKRVQT